MNKSKFTDELKALQSNVESTLHILIEQYYTTSEVNGEKTIILKEGEDDDLMFNLDGSAYIVEVQKDNFISNEGNYYSLDVLTVDELCQFVDHFRYKLLS